MRSIAKMDEKLTILNSNRKVYSKVFHLLVDDVTLIDNCRVASLPASIPEPVVHPQQHDISADATSGVQHSNHGNVTETGTSNKGAKVFCVNRQLSTILMNSSL